MKLMSSAFFNGAFIPYQYTCDGDNISPPLNWENAPKETKSFVLLCDDTDTLTGVWRHWAAYDIPAGHTELVEGAGIPRIYEDFRHGINDFKNFGYGGPCPQHHKGIQHYNFRLLALSCPELSIRTHPKCSEVEIEARKFVIEEAILVGVYQR